MGKTRQSNKRIFKIEKLVIFLEIIPLLLLTFRAGYLYMSTSISKIDKNNLDGRYLQTLNSLDNNKKNIVYANEGINFVKEIDLKIAKVKEQYFIDIGKLEQAILSGKSDKKIAYLTFDDGPYTLTNRYLDILKEYDVQATFFTTGRSGEEQILKRIVAEDHVLANHTYSHQMYKGIYESTNAFMFDALYQEKYLKQITGVTTNIIRFPGGSSSAGANKDSIVAQLHEKGYGYVDWTAWSGDGKHGLAPTVADAINLVNSTIAGQKIAVVLMHDYSYITCDALPTIIQNLRNQGYILLPLFKDSVMVK